VYLAAGSSSSSLSFIILIVVLGGGYLMFVRSIQRRQRNQATAQQDMRSSLTPGTEIVTIGGLFATVVDVDDEAVTLEISDGVTARYDRNAIAKVVTPAEHDDEPDEDQDDEAQNGPDTDLVSESDKTELDDIANSIIKKKD
jgi:preprotein translocase subunit YajC